MAFTLQNLSRSSASGNEPIITLDIAGTARVDGCFREYNYYSADTQVAIATASYFDDAEGGFTTGDYISVYSTTDGSRCTYRLTNTAGVITVALISGRIQAAVPITAAQFNGMYAASIVLLAAPGAGRAYLLNGAHIAHTDATQYDNGGDVAIQYDDTAAGAGTICSSVLAAASVIAYTADRNIVLLPQAAATIDEVSANITNQGLYLGNITGAYDTGTGTWIVNVVATIVPTA